MTTETVIASVDTTEQKQNQNDEIAQVFKILRDMNQNIVLLISSVEALKCQRENDQSKAFEERVSKDSVEIEISYVDIDEN